MKPEVVHIANDHITASIKVKGAELISMIPESHGKELIWQGDPKVWGGQAPVLFPIIGCLKDGFMTYGGQKYATTKHGLIRHNEEISVVSKNANQVVCQLKSSAKTKALYPFDFTFEITYRLEENRLVVDHTIVNEGSKVMLFSVGAHPAFNIPLFENESYDDYFLEFSEVESSRTWEIDSAGLIKGEGELILDKSDKLPLSHDLFSKDALVFKDLKSRSTQMVSSSNGPILAMDYDEFPYLGIWAKPKGDFVCIEPWQGIADASNSDQVFANKEGLISLEAGSTYRTSYSIKAF